jgi:glycosyltransferase involved in cell wall biosynthesis
MQVLMFSWEYPPHIVGGLGKHVTELLPALAHREDVRIHLVTPRWAGGELLDSYGSVVIHRVEPPSVNGEIYTAAWQTNLVLQRYAEALWQEQGPFDLVHAHDWLVAFAANAVKVAYKVPLIATIHATERGRWRGHLGSDLSRSIHHVEWWLTYEAWRIITCSEYMAGEVRDFFACPADKIEVIPNGVDIAPFQIEEGLNLDGFRSMYALPEEQIVFGVGRMVYEKGAGVLIEAVPHVLAQVPTAKFVVAGRGPLVGELRRRAWELGVGEKVLFAGYVPDRDRNQLYRLAACAVFPSLYEPFGMVALEAMAARCPVVASEIGGLKEVVKHAETGVTVYPDSPQSLAWGIVQTLSDRERARRLAENAYRMVADLYNWERIVRLTVEMYQRVLDERKRAEW